LILLIVALVDTNKLDISNVRFLVLDEADQLIKDSENYNLIMKLYKKIPKTTKPLQVLHFRMKKTKILCIITVVVFSSRCCLILYFRSLCSQQLFTIHKSKNYQR
jgi:hypothetical protein